MDRRGGALHDFDDAFDGWAVRGHDATSHAPQFPTTGLIVAGGALSLVLLLPFLKRAAPVLVALYARFAGDDLLAHPTRRKVSDAIRAQPGVTTATLARDLRLNPGTLAHHLRALERAGLVKVLCVGRDRAWYAADAPRATREAPMPEARREVVRVVQERPGLTQAEAARALGVAPPTVHHHVRRRAADGAVDVRRDGRVTRLFVLRPP